MNKVKLTIITAVTIFILSIGAITFANSAENEVKTSFADKQKKLGLIKEEIIIAEGKLEELDVKITNKEFVEFKENLRMVHNVNKVPFKIDDEEIVNEMINDKLFVNDAKTKNITVTKEEVLEYAMQTKKAYDENTIPELKQMLTEMANQLNVSESDYFTHPDVLKKYEEFLITNKLIEILVQEGEIDEEGKTIDKYASKLKEKNKGKVKINLKNLKNNN